MKTSVKRMVTRVAKGAKPGVAKVQGPLVKGTKGLIAGPKAPRLKK